jgi:hypothetical protein
MSENFEQYGDPKYSFGIQLPKPPEEEEPEPPPTTTVDTEN